MVMILKDELKGKNIGIVYEISFLIILIGIIYPNSIKYSMFLIFILSFILNFLME